MKGLKLGLLPNTPDLVLRQISEEKGLEQLFIIDCPTMTVNTLEKILKSCGNLRRLVVAYGSELVTPEIFQAYLRSGSKSQLELVQCKGIKAEMLPEELRQLGKVLIDEIKDRPARAPVGLFSLWKQIEKCKIKVAQSFFM